MFFKELTIGDFFVFENLSIRALMKKTAEDRMQSMSSGGLLAIVNDKREVIRVVLDIKILRENEQKKHKQHRIFLPSDSFSKRIASTRKKKPDFLCTMD